MARLLALISLVALAGIIGCGTGGGTASDISPKVTTAAFLREQGITCTPGGTTTYRIRLHNSGASCAEAGADFMISPAGTEGSGPIYSDGRVVWICNGLPPAQAPLIVRCHKGSRYFTVERVHRSGVGATIVVTRGQGKVAP